MIPYLILLFVPLICSLVSFTTKDRGRKWILLVGPDKKIRNDSFMLPVFFIILFLLLALRDETIGRDLANYKRYFERYSDDLLRAIQKEKMDVLYWGLNWVVGRFTDDFQWFLVVVTAITVLPIAKIYCEDKENGFLKIILFVNMSTFIMLFSGLRQALAISVGLIAYGFLREKKVFKFVIAALIAFGFHHTGFMVLVFYPVYHLTIKKKHLWYVVPCIILVFVFNKQIFSYAAEFLNAVLGEKYDTTMEDTGSYTMLILFALFAVMAYVLPDEDRMDEEAMALRNFLLVTVTLQCFAPVNTLAMRMNYYFIIFVPVLVPKILKHTKQQFSSMAPLLGYALTVFFTCYYLYGTYISCQTGISALDTYPYVPFWK